jgi:hypothetical protein
MPILTPAPALPSVSGVRAATPADAGTIAWWTLRSVMHRRPLWFKVLIFGVLPLALLLLNPWSLLFVSALTLAGTFGWQWVALTTRLEVAAIYCPDGRPLASVSVRRGRRAWHPGTHLARTIGVGHGAALRALVVPALLDQADALGVALVATAASESLARRYAADVPGLVDVGKGRPFGRKLRRDPN